MVKSYRKTPMTRLVNALFSAATEHGRGAAYRHVLIVRGRKSGQDRSVPVDVMTLDGTRYLVAPYGVVGWVHNVRAAGQVRLARGGTTATFRATEVHGLAALPAIRQYIRSVPVTRQYWEVGPDATDEEVLAIADRHPVFRLEPV